MTGESAMRPDYGIDAPGVIRNLAIAAISGLAIWGTAAAGLWSGAIGNPRVVRIDVAHSVIWPALCCGGMAVWMLWHSKVGKVREREALLNQLRWTGAEHVLDVGCGRGLMLIGAAKRLSSGEATGIDIWQAEDLSGNRPDATLENAEREAVADRVKIRTADMRELPFPDASFDVVVSSAAIHNLYAATERAKAIREIARVLKGGGQLLVDDIRHGSEYLRVFTVANCVVRRTDTRLVSWLLTVLTFGSLRPVTVVGTRTA